MITVRRATKDDVSAVVDIVEDLDRFYGATSFDDVAERRKSVTTLLFGATPVASVLLAEDDGRAVGMASYSCLWPAEGVTASLYMKELYVSPSHRKQGVGRRLIGAICAIATEAEFSRVEWTTDRDNPDAQAFYGKIGAEISQSKLMYRVDGELLAALAETKL